MNLRNDRESKDWGISKALTSIYIVSQIYTRHVPFHTENCFFHIYSSIHLERKTVQVSKRCSATVENEAPLSYFESRTPNVAALENLGHTAPVYVTLLLMATLGVQEPEACLKTCAFQRHTYSI